MSKTFKLIEKTENGVLFKVNNEVLKIPNKVFDSFFEEDTQCQGSYRLKKEVVKELQPKLDFVQDHFVEIMMILHRISSQKPGSTTLSAMLHLGSLSEMFCKKFNSSPFEFVELIKEYQGFIKQATGIEFRLPNMKDRSFTKKQKPEEPVKPDTSRTYRPFEKLKEKSQQKE